MNNTLLSRLITYIFEVLHFLNSNKPYLVHNTTVRKYMLGLMMDAQPSASLCKDHLFCSGVFPLKTHISNFILMLHCTYIHWKAIAHIYIAFFSRRVSSDIEAKLLIYKAAYLGLYLVAFTLGMIMMRPVYTAE